MHRTIRDEIIAVCACVLLIGCQSSSADKMVSKDPLLLSNKPVEGKMTETDEGPLLFAGVEPVIPAIPKDVLVHDSAPTAKFANRATQAPVPIHPIPSASRPAEGRLAIRSQPERDAGATASTRRQVPGKYGHAPDYAWLQGVVDKHFDNHLYLRYCEAQIEEAMGGKVRLEDDPRLQEYQSGDVILVQGSIVPDSHLTRKGGWRHYPLYRVQHVWLVERQTK
ncbi:MAG: hypothetical protein ACK4RK_06245 [Gemmataceae bacterium]